MYLFPSLEQNNGYICFKFQTGLDKSLVQKSHTHPIQCCQLSEPLGYENTCNGKSKGYRAVKWHQHLHSYTCPTESKARRTRWGVLVRKCSCMAVRKISSMFDNFCHVCPSSEDFPHSLLDYNQVSISDYNWSTDIKHARYFPHCHDWTIPHQKLTANGEDFAEKSVIRGTLLSKILIMCAGLKRN